MNQNNANKGKIIEKIQLELLSTLFKYVVPFIEAKTKRQKEKTSKLEDIVSNQRPKIDFRDIKELESLLLKNLSENVKAGRNIGVSSKDVFYSLNLTRSKKGNEIEDKYSISIKYDENENEERLKISVKKNETELYSSEIASKKEARDKAAPYSIRILYENNYSEERLAITYRQQLKNYMKNHIESKEDMSNMVPLKWLNLFPESMMGGVLGFTYLGENFMGRRADLVGKTARMVDIHESIHTPDEYETRILTSWIMEKARSKYIK